ncbi:MAG: HAD hydrolase-like protein [Lachnospiraceae bacterium]|nr:HAD hydrolase-like protein [Lachnospiraceae bacterium]
MYKYILFDLDGTLTDPKEGICRSVQYALEKMGIEEKNTDRLTVFIGPPLADSFREHYGLDKEHCDKAIEYYRERFSSVGWKENIPYEGVGSMLSRLKSSGAKLAVASSKPTVFVEKILKYFGLRRYFSVVVGSELNGSRSSKEEVVEEVFRQLYAKDRSGKSREELKNLTVMVGDRKYDIEGAHEKGIEAIGAAYGYQQDGELAEAGADAIASDMEELCDLLIGGRETENDRKKKLPRSSFVRALYMLVPFALYILVFRLSIALMRAVSLVFPAIRTDGGIYISLTVYVIIAAVLYAAFRKKEPLDLFGRVPTAIPAAAFFCGIFLAAALNLYAVKLMEVLKTSAEVANAAAFKAESAFLPGLLVYVALSPLCEEMCFRWLMFGRIRRCIGAGPAVVTTALFFGLFHGNPVQGIYAFIMGFIMAVFYQKTGAFLTSLLFHVGANAVIYVAAYVGKSGGELDEIVTATGCLLASLPLLWYVCREQKSEEKKRTGKINGSR